MARRTGRTTADTDWTRSNEHLPTMRSAGNLRLPRRERRNDLVLHHSPAWSGLGRRTARPDHPSSASPICNPLNEPMTDPHLVTLNPEQRQAVEHGVEPLLINAGAGSGKTKTLAHRVAHLIVGGVDPRRIMLLTFSRRAAEEMIRRVQRLASQVLPKQARLMVDALTWSGTFNAIGSRLLREYSDQIGLDRDFTIHD